MGRRELKVKAPKLEGRGIKGTAQLCSSLSLPQPSRKYLRPSLLPWRPGSTPAFPLMSKPYSSRGGAVQILPTPRDLSRLLPSQPALYLIQPPLSSPGHVVSAASHSPPSLQMLVPVLMPVFPAQPRAFPLSRDKKRTPHSPPLSISSRTSTAPYPQQVLKTDLVQKISVPHVW